MLWWRYREPYKFQLSNSVKSQVKHSSWETDKENEKPICIIFQTKCKSGKGFFKI